MNAYENPADRGENKKQQPDCACMERSFTLRGVDVFQVFVQ